MYSCACLAYFLVMHHLLYSRAFIHLHCASHLGTLNESREGCDVRAEPEDGVWWTYLEDGRTKQVLGSEVSFRQCKLT
jgi:hypothetical protein